MIQHLRRKFVAIAMGSLLVIIVLIIGAINGFNYYTLNREADSLLALLAENDGNFPANDRPQESSRPPEGERQPDGGNPPSSSTGKPPEPRDPGFRMTAETRFETRFFSVHIGEGGAISQVDVSQVAAISQEQAEEYALQVLISGKTSGFQDIYKYLLVEQEQGRLIVFIDRRMQLENSWSFFNISCVIAVISLLVMFVLVSIFSKRAVRPVAESMEKQKRFITDAGHEIKTPLAIISANNDVLELSYGASEWTASIRNQTERLDALVKNLLSLAKMEEQTVQQDFLPVALSDLVWQVASSFETMAEVQNKSLELNIQPDLSCLGDEAALRQLVSILADNALKYVDEQGEIRVELHKTGKHTCLAVRNTCSTPPVGDLNRLFDRFYRADSSRARESGGYGIGLSIAKAIVEAHRGKITAQYADGAICFTVTL